MAPDTAALSRKRAYILRRCQVARRTARLSGAATLYCLFGATGVISHCAQRPRR